MLPAFVTRRFSAMAKLTGLVVALSLPPAVLMAEITPLMQSIAVEASEDRDIAAFYRANGFQPIWTGTDADAKARRAAFIATLEQAHLHGLPANRYRIESIDGDLTAIRSERDLARVEVAMTRLFLKYAREVQNGVLTPSRIDSGLVREILYRDRTALLTDFVTAAPTAFFRQLPPQTPEYARLMREKLAFEEVVARGGWGARVEARKLEPGDSGTAVVQLRNRLIAMGYLPRTATAGYDAAMTRAVERFQADHGLATDGVAGPATMAEINLSAERRLGQIHVAMERERWLNRADGLGARHVWVNLTDFKARVVDDGKVSFETRSVIGKNIPNQRSPEFSDTMEHMVINPTWNVPRSIATKEYLPQLKRNPFAVQHLTLTDRRGRRVNRAAVDFTQFSAGNFPFDMKQAPGRRNALGLVKFMFPNRHNIYLHDTPAKSLFARDRRDFSHGCIRLADPFDFAHHLLARQVADPADYFQARLRTGRETTVPLEQPIPVHIVYRTAYTQAKGRIQFRHDVYGRDAKIWDALQDAGVALAASRS